MSAPPNNDYFYPGSIVSCKIFDQKEDIKGEVYAFDHDSRSLLLKSPSSNGKKECSNVTLINLKYVSDVQVLKECTDRPPQLLPMEHRKLDQRYNREKELRMNVAEAVSNGVTKVGVELFLYMKRIFKETAFKDQNIVIMEDVTIEPPYEKQNCSADNPTATHCLSRVMNMVERFYDDKSRTPQQPSTTT